MILPILIIVISNCVYNICTKSAPGNINPFGTLIITYLVGTIITLLLFLIMVKPENVAVELSKLNWTSVVLGIAIVGLEAGYIWAYREGWQISNASIVANICLAISLIFIGLFLYGEEITLKQITGILVCIVGLVLITV